MVSTLRRCEESSTPSGVRVRCEPGLWLRSDFESVVRGNERRGGRSVAQIDIRPDSAVDPEGADHADPEAGHQHEADVYFEREQRCLPSTSLSIELRLNESSTFRRTAAVARHSSGDGFWPQRRSD